MNPFLNWILIDNVFFEDDFDFIRCDVCVPNAFRPDEEDWPLFADAQAIGFAP